MWFFRSQWAPLIRSVRHVYVLWGICSTWDIASIWYPALYRYSGDRWAHPAAAIEMLWLLCVRLAGHQIEWFWPVSIAEWPCMASGYSQSAEWNNNASHRVFLQNSLPYPIQRNCNQTIISTFDMIPTMANILVAMFWIHTEGKLSSLKFSKKKRSFSMKNCHIMKESNLKIFVDQFLMLSDLSTNHLSFPCAGRAHRAYLQLKWQFVDL